MNFEKYTERARGFVQSAQTGALAAGNQQFTPEHLLKVLLDDPEGLAAGLIERAGGACARCAGRDRAGACRAAQGQRRRRPALPRAADGQGFRHRREDRQEGRRLLRHRRAAAAGAGDGEGRRDGEDPRRRRRHAADAQRGHRGNPQGTHRRFGVRREPVRRAEEIRARPHRRRPATASSTRSSAATRRSAAPSRCCRGAPRTIPC